MDMHKIDHTEDPVPKASQHYYSSIMELRQYTLHPGQRDVLIELFERVCIEPQQALGVTVIGQFRDLENPNRFVWLRGFTDMDKRYTALQAYYGGALWKEYREQVIVTLVDSDNVLLLHPAQPTSGFYLDPGKRLPYGSQKEAPGLVVATILSFEIPPSASFLDFFENTLAPALTRNGASILSYFETEQSANKYLDLPVREGEQVFVWFSRFEDQAAYDKHLAALLREEQWHNQIWEPMLHRFKAVPAVLKLAPTARSLV